MVVDVVRACTLRQNIRLAGSKIIALAFAVSASSDLKQVSNLGQKLEIHRKRHTHTYAITPWVIPPRPQTG